MNGALLDWGLATATQAGEAISGDRGLVLPGPGGVLLAVVDGAGHGPEAARAAEKAAEILEHSADRGLSERLALCHQALGGTRGAVLLAAVFKAADATLSWAGVGDVIGVLVRADPRARPRMEVLFPREGILGFSLPPLSSARLAVHDGDLLVLATDGVRDDFVHRVPPVGEPRAVAVRILEQHGKGTDDALVLAARFRVRPE